MANSNEDSQGLAVPRQRFTRLARFGGLGAGIAGNMIADGAGKLARGERPDLQDLLLTPSNAAKVADQLSQLRGAAMKLGQLISMDAGDFFPPEFASVLARLRSSAHSMPPHQLKTVLNDNWGRGWLKNFKRFDTRPIAAASIGQVHRAQTKDGCTLAVKVQYPGVRRSIDSDVDNVAALIKVSGLLPNGVDIAPLLDEAKRQLKQEADYEREGACLRRFGVLLADDHDFLLPQLDEALTTENILSMEFMDGNPIETLSSAPQAVRDRVVSLLITLMMRELFDFRLMQTDPNFANYFYTDDAEKIVLLDFGATREISEALSSGYRALLAAGLKSDWEAARATAVTMGLMGDKSPESLEALMRETFQVIMEPIQQDGTFDFGATDIAMRLRDKGMALRTGGFHHVPPPATVFFHRKFGGVYLLASTLRARVNVGAIVRPYVAGASV